MMSRSHYLSGVIKTGEPFLVEDDVKLQFSGERLDKTEHWNSWILEGTREHKIAITVKNIAKFDYQIRCYQYTPLQSIIPITLPLRL